MKYLKVYLIITILVAVALLGFSYDSYTKANNTLGAGSSSVTPAPIKTFLGLTDTPNSYSGANSKCVAVNSGASALEFATCGTGGGSGGSNWATTTAGVLYPVDYATRRIVTGGNSTTTLDFLQA